jgi:hypothetical protein
MRLKAPVGLVQFFQKIQVNKIAVAVQRTANIALYANIKRMFRPSVNKNKTIRILDCRILKPGELAGCRNSLN